MHNPTPPLVELPLPGIGYTLQVQQYYDGPYGVVLGQEIPNVYTTVTSTTEPVILTCDGQVATGS